MNLTYFNYCFKFYETWKETANILHIFTFLTRYNQKRIILFRTLKKKKKSLNR